MLRVRGAEGEGVLKVVGGAQGRGLKVRGC